MSREQDTVINVENVSKRYRVGAREEQADTFAGQIYNLVKAPFRNFKRLKKLKSFRKSDDNVNWALKDINFKVNRGEVLGIIGHNGAGKSTLLKVLSHITEPTTGEIKLKGRVSSLLEVGTGFHPELTGRDNIYMNGTILGMTKKEIDVKFEEIVDFSGVARYIDTPVKFYSSGMKVRLGFSVAAHLEPEILIIDEVLAVGDVSFQKKCLGKMDDVASSGRTVLFVSHDMSAVENLCSRTIHIAEGKMVFNGDTKEAINDYVNHSLNKKEIKISERSDRKGNGSILFTDTWIENKQGNKITTLKTGEDFNICVSYEIKEGNNKNLEFAFAINTVRGFSITDLSTHTAGHSFGDKRTATFPEVGVVKCEVIGLNLNIGRYNYNILVRRNNILEDWIREANSFNIEQTDFFGTGKLPDSNRLLVCNQNWSLIKK